MQVGQGSGVPNEMGKESLQVEHNAAVEDLLLVNGNFAEENEEGVDEDMKVEQNVAVNIVDGLVRANEHSLGQSTSGPTSDNGRDILKPHFHPNRPFYADSIENYEHPKVILHENRRHILNSTCQVKSFS